VRSSILRVCWVKLTKTIFFHAILILPFLVGVPYTDASDGNFYLNFPLSGYTAYTAPISAVFDHSMSNGIVISYTGETGDYQNYSASCDCYDKSDGQSFRINEHYVGARSCGATYYLCYDGHRGTDYPVVNNTPVYTAANGIAHLPAAFPGVSNAQEFNTIEIDHQNGYKTYYLHLSSHTVVDGQNVTRGQLIGYSGDVGSSGAYHLHFEV